MDFDNSFLDSVLEGAEEAIDMTLDAVQEQDTEIEETITTDVDDVEIDSIIGDDGKGSSALISDDDIEKIDSGKDPDFDRVDIDAAKGAKDKEINDLEKDIEDGSIITKNEIKELKEGQELLDFVGSVVSEDFELPSTGEENIGEEYECGVCHCTPCICKERVDMITHPSEEGQQPRLISNKVPTDGVIFSDDNEYDDHTGEKLTFSMNQPHTVKEDDLFDNINQDLTGVESDDEIHGNDTHELFSDDDDDDDEDLDDHDNDDDDDDKDDEDEDGDDKDDEDDLDEDDDDEDDNEPAGPVQPLTDSKEQNQYGFRFENNNEEGDLNMFEDEELFDESFDDEDLDIEDIADESAEEQESEEEYTFSLDEQAEDYDDDTQFALENASDDKAEDITGEMDGLEDVDMFNSFEGSGINTKQYGEDDFLTGMNKNIDEPSGSFTSQDSLKFSQVDTRPFGKAEDPSIADMIK